MNYLLEAAIQLGIYYTPAHVLALCFGDGKTRTREDFAAIMGNPPFATRLPASPRYRALARHYAQLVAIAQPSEGELAEMQRVSDEMAEIEMTWATAQSGALA